MINVLIWGTGSACEKRQKGLEHDNISILAFIDNNIDKQGGFLHGRPIISPKQINSYHYDYILIASTFEDEIMKQIITMDIATEYIIPYNISLSDMKSFSEIFSQKQIMISGLEEINRQINFAVHDVKSSITNMNYLEIDSYISSAAFIKNAFSDAGNKIKRDKMYTDINQYYDAVISKAKSDPDWEKYLYLEFGVFSGRTINYLSSKLDDTMLHGFDSFAGLPEDWRPGFDKHTFDRNGKLPYVNNNVKLHKGWFHETLPEFLKEYGTTKCALIHVDCDLYTSTKTIFDFLEGNITKGTILMFDELVGYFGWQGDEYRALMEFVQKTGHEIEYIACVYGGQQVAVEIVS